MVSFEFQLRLNGYGRFVFLVGVLFVCFCTGLAFAAKGEPDAKKLPIVSLAEIKTKELYDQYTYPARVKPLVNASILAEASGVVQKIYAPLGSKVKKGQRIASIRHTDPVYQYRSQVVRAPVDGIVSDVRVSEGSQVTAQQNIFSVTDPGKVRIYVEVAADDLPAITKGTQGSFVVSGRNERLPVTVVGVSPFVKATTGTATCEIALGETSDEILPGLVGQVLFRTNVREGIAIPAHMIQYKEKQIYVRTVDGQMNARYVNVTLGRKQNGEVEITSGLEAGMRVIERNSRYVPDGGKVQLAEPKQSAADQATKQKRNQKG